MGQNFGISGWECTSHRKCFSLGFHVDFKHKHLDLHLLWFFISIGNQTYADFKDPEKEKEFSKMLNEHRVKEDMFLKEHGVTPALI